jgi:hypothetical protein
MKFTNTTLLLIILSLLLNIVSSKNSNDDQINEISCLGRYTGVFHSYIYFNKNETSTDYYVIRTAWMLSYPNKIKTQLKSNNFNIFDSNPSNECGWKLISRITNIGIYTGYIYVKGNNVNTIDEIAGDILRNTYPTLEIMLIIFMPIIGVILIIMVLFIYDKYKTNNDNYNGIV